MSSRYYNAGTFLHTHTKRMKNIEVAGLFTLLGHFHEHKQLLRYLKLSEDHFKIYSCSCTVSHIHTETIAT